MQKTSTSLVIISIIFLSLFALKSNAQSPFYKYNYIDTNNIGNGLVKEYIPYQGDLIVAGGFTDKNQSNPCVKRIDTLGNVLWSSTDSDTSSAASCWGNIDKIILVDSFIYYSTAGYLNQNALRKINANTGALIWQTSLTSLSITYIKDLENLNSTEIGIYYLSQTTHYLAICKFNKTTGVATNYNIGGQIFLVGTKPQGMCVDANNDIYVSRQDSVVKLDGTTMNIIWTKPLITGYVHDLLCSPTDSIIAIVHTSNLSECKSINKANGAVQWTTSNSGPNAAVVKSIIRGNYLYNTFRTTSFKINKINITNGNEEWSTGYVVNPAFDHYIFDLTIDNNFIYTIGYKFCAISVTKLNTLNGNLVSNTSLPYTYCNQNLRTWPKIHLQNGSLYTISSDQEDTLGSLGNFEPVRLNKINPSNLVINSNTIIEGNYHFSSKTVDVKNRANNKRLVLKKTGKSGELIMYNSAKQVMWKRAVGHNFYSDFGPISFANDGRIVVTSFNHSASCNPGLYTAYAWEITQEYFDSTGTSLYENVQFLNSYNYTYYSIASVMPDTGYHSMIIMHKPSSVNRVLNINDQGISNLLTLSGTNYINFSSMNFVEPFALTRTVDSFTYINVNESNVVRYYSFDIANNTSSPIKTITTNKDANYYIKVPAQNSFIIGTEDNGTPYTVERFDNNTNTIVWSTAIAQPVKKLVTSNNNQYVYVLAINSGWPGETWIYKIDINTGTIIWQRTNGSTANAMPLQFEPTDINISANTIAISGKKLIGSPRKIGLFRYDFSGTLIDTFISIEPYLDTHDDQKVAHWSNGSNWLYGTARYPSAPQNLYNNWGIIYDTDSVTNSLVTYSTINQSACNSFMFNNQNLSTSGTYFDTLFNANANGADSIITLNLVINQPTSGTINQIACDSFTFNNLTLTQSGIYYDTTLNSAGCDSITTLNLTLNQTMSIVINQTSCDSFIYNNQWFTQSGTYHDTLVNLIGCDTLVTLNLTLSNTNNTSLNLTACDSFMFNNHWLTQSGTYYDTLINLNGCDTLVTLNLTVNNANAGITQNGPILSATANGATYQWVTCNPSSSISNANSQTYTATSNGDYAVTVTQNGCTKTSACLTVTGVGIKEINKNKLRIVPNPTKDKFTILSSRKNINKAQVKIITLMGQVVFNRTINKNTKEFSIDISNLTNGFYHLEVRENNNLFTRIKLLKE